MRYVIVALAFLTSCGNDLYRSCGAPGDCDAPEEIDAVCLDNSGDDGFCTWACEVDADCNDADDDDFDFVCAPFESTEGMHCFPSCEAFDEGDEDACPGDLGCRSTGGGSENRKVCFPNESAD